MAPHKQMEKETQICLWGVFYRAETLIIIVLCSLCRKNTVCERYDFDFYPCVILQSEKVKCIIEIR